MAPHRDASARERLASATGKSRRPRAAGSERIGAAAGELGNFLFEVRRTSHIRDMRDALLGLAYALMERDQRRSLEGSTAKQPPAKALLVLVSAHLTKATQEAELARFRAVADKDVAQRVFAVAASEDGQVDPGELPGGIPAELQQRIAEAAGKADPRAAGAGRVSRQTVKAILLESYLAGTRDRQLDISTVADLGRVSGASYPTVSSALKELDAAYALSSVRHKGLKAQGCTLLKPSVEIWRLIAGGYAAERRTVRYVDPTRHARPERLLANLQRLLSERRARSAQSGDEVADAHIALGGVLGAKAHFASLDISIAMRLDLCVFDGDGSFVSELDPGLVPTDDPKAKAILVLHFTRDIRLNHGPDANAKASVDHEEIFPASATDCYADLVEMGYVGEAREFAIAVTSKAG